jgi:hypothetical protein
MKVFVMYDDTGKIRGTAATSEPNLRPGLHPALSCLEEEHDVEPERITQYLRNLHDTSRVDVTSDVPRRVPR